MSADPHEPNVSSESATSSAASRRKLLKLGAGSVPVLMALASRSAFACHSTTPSAFGSVCVSRPEMLQSSSGQSPGFWKNHTGPTYWPTPYYSNDIKIGRTTYKATTFKAAFCSSGAPSPFTTTTTLLDVLGSGGGGSTAVARACVAALLNAASGRTPNTIMTANDVIDIWYQYATKGFFEPVVGVKWYASTPQLPYINGSDTGGQGGVIGYLNTTWT